MTDPRSPAVLEVLGPDAAGTSLLLRDPSRPGVTVTLPLDARLRAAVAPAPGDGQLALGLGPPPSPREIQARLRAGESVESIAASAGVPAEKVARWEGPVLAERAHLLDRALATPVGESGASLADAVAAHLGMLGIDPATVAWTLLREPDSDPVVHAARPGREGRWSFSVAARRLTPLDAGASTLLDDPPPPSPRRLRSAPTPHSPAVPVEVEGLLPLGDPSPDGPDGPDADDAAEDRPAMPGWDEIVRGSRSRQGRGPLDALLDGPAPDPGSSGP